MTNRVVSEVNATRETRTEPLEYSARPYHSEQRAYTALCKAMDRRSDDYMVGHVYQAFGAWHWYIGYDRNAAAAEREAAEKAVQS